MEIGKSATRSSPSRVKRLVGSDADVDVQVAGAATAGADRTAAGEPQRRTGVDTGGDVDLVGLLGDDPAVAVARRARCDDDLAEPAAPRARRWP